MFIINKNRTITNVLKISVPDISSSTENHIDEALIGQVFCTIENNSSCTITKDIWDKKLYNLFSDQIEEEIYNFELECKQDILNQGVKIESNRDLIFNNKIEELEQNKLIINEELLMQSEAQLDLDFRLTSMELGL